MRNKSVICIVIALLTVTSTAFSACNNDSSESESTTAYEYISSGGESATGEESSDANQGEIKIDRSWENNFDVTYNTYNPEVSPTPMKVRERKSESAYIVEYVDGNSFYYYKQNGADVDKYTVIENESEQLHAVYKNKHISALTALFGRSSEVDKNFPLLGNVCYEYDEVIAGRQCGKYLQRAYENGEATATLFIWIDNEYGFALKQEEYDAEGRLVAKLEVIEFSCGSTKDEDVIIDLSEYTFKEEQ